MVKLDCETNTIDCIYCKNKAELIIVSEIKKHKRWGIKTDESYYIKCPKCGTETHFYKEKLGAVDAWNNRNVIVRY